MKPLEEHKEELIENLINDGWRTEVNDLEYEEEIYCVKAQKKMLVFFNRTHIYVLVKEVHEDNFERLVDLVKNNFVTYHAVWLVADSFSEEVKNYAGENQQIGLIKIEVE